MLDAIERFLGATATTPSTPTACWRRSSPRDRRGRADAGRATAFEAHVRARSRVVPRPPAGALAATRIQAAFDGPARAIRCAAALVAAGRRARPRRAGRPAHRRVRARRRRACAAAPSTCRSDLSALAAPAARCSSAARVVDLVAGSGPRASSRAAPSRSAPTAHVRRLRRPRVIFAREPSPPEVRSDVLTERLPGAQDSPAWPPRSVRQAVTVLQPSPAI